MAKKKTEADPVIGRKVVRVMWLTPTQVDRLGWEPGGHEARMGVMLDNGAILIASRDSEGNGPGAMFLMQQGNVYDIYPPTEPTNEECKHGMTVASVRTGKTLCAFCGEVVE